MDGVWLGRQEAVDISDQGSILGKGPEAGQAESKAWEGGVLERTKKEDRSYNKALL